METSTPRARCPRCRKALVTCYCRALRPFAAPMPFVILQHRDESRNAIATGRMAHLSIVNSHLFVDYDYGDHPEVGRLLADGRHRDYLLFPGPQAVPLEDVWGLPVPGALPPRFWVLDARWSQVPKVLRHSQNLQALPMARLTPSRPSMFQVREQPRPECLSTVEAVFEVIDHYVTARGLPADAHRGLLQVFARFVEQQLRYVREVNDRRYYRARAEREGVGPKGQSGA